MRQVAVTGLYKAFGTHPVLTGVDLEVPAGSLTAILGPSGSGKTTLLRLLASFERANAGTISIGDSLVGGPGVSVAPERRRIGYVPAGRQPVPASDHRGQRRVRPARPGPPRQAGGMLEMVGPGRAIQADTRTSCPAASSSGSRWPGLSFRRYRRPWKRAESFSVRRSDTERGIHSSRGSLADLHGMLRKLGRRNSRSGNLQLQLDVPAADQYYNDRHTRVRRLARPPRERGSSSKHRDEYDTVFYYSRLRRF